MNHEKVVLVTRKTPLEGLIERFNSRSQAKFYIEHSEGNFNLFEREHETYYEAVRHLRRGLQQLAKVETIERGFLPNYLFGEEDLVVTIGVDGLVVNTAKYLRGQPIVAVNPDPKRIDGVLLPFTVHTAQDAIRNIMRGQGKFRHITMAEVVLNDGQRLLAFNDLFIGAQTHISARYQIRFKGQCEDHSSSGIIVSTGAGATGWLSSLFNMAEGLYSQLENQSGTRLTRPQLDWEDEELMFVVREPFISKTTSSSLVCGMITKDSKLVIESHMPDGGVIFSDGVEADFLAFNAGTVATIGAASQKTKLVVG